MKHLNDTYKVRSTKNYGIFRLVDGNRDVSHAARLKKSIEEVGLLVCPILCNEKMEIIDGQGRFTACKELNLPVYYLVQEGIGIEEVRKMNSVSTNWKIRDYVHSYTAGEQEKENYRFYENLCRQFPMFGNKVIMTAIRDYSATHYAEKIRNGDLVCGQDEYERAVKILDWLKKFSDYVKTIGGRKDFMYTALIWCYRSAELDTAYLLKKFAQKYKACSDIASERSAIENIEKIYNFRIDKEHQEVYLVSDYEKYKKLCKANALERN